jgi:hypothetical protein
MQGWNGKTTKKNFCVAAASRRRDKQNDQNNILHHMNAWAVDDRIATRKRRGDSDNRKSGTGQLGSRS